MADGVRDRMVDGAARLLAQQGYQATSFSSVLAASGAPRGSIYHHFPGGKDELVLAAIDRAWERTAAIVDGLAQQTRPEEVVSSFVGVWRALLSASDYGIGCSVLGVTVSTGDPEILARAARVFRAWRGRLADALVSAGLDPARGDELGTLLLASCEGAVVLCRAERSLEALELVEGSLRAYAAALTPRRPA